MESYKAFMNRVGTHMFTFGPKNLTIEIYPTYPGMEPDGILGFDVSIDGWDITTSMLWEQIVDLVSKMNLEGPKEYQFEPDEDE